jgi:hypothetical protein
MAKQRQEQEVEEEGFKDKIINILDYIGILNGPFSPLFCSYTHLFLNFLNQTIIMIENV